MTQGNHGGTISIAALFVQHDHVRERIGVIRIEKMMLGGGAGPNPDATITADYLTQLAVERDELRGRELLPASTRPVGLRQGWAMTLAGVVSGIEPPVQLIWPPSV